MKTMKAGVAFGLVFLIGIFVIMAGILDLHVTGAQVAVKTISLNPYSALLSEGAHFSTSGFDGPIRLPGNSSTPGLSMGFIVPDDHSPDSSLTVNILWETRLTECFVVFASNYLFRAREGHPQDGGNSAGGLDPLDGSTQNLIHAITGSSIQVETAANSNDVASVRFTISPSPGEFETLRAGDAVNFSIFRADNDPEDTCAGGIGIAGMSIQYVAQLD